MIAATINGQGSIARLDAIETPREVNGAHTPDLPARG